MRYDYTILKRMYGGGILEDTTDSKKHAFEIARMDADGRRVMRYKIERAEQDQVIGDSELVKDWTEPKMIRK